MYVCACMCLSLIDAIEKKRAFFSVHCAYLLAYQVLSNHNEPQAIWFDNSELKSSPEADSDDVILIDDDDGDGNDNDSSGGSGDFENTNSNSNSLIQEPSDNNSSSSEQKLHTCGICNSKLSSSYNLKRHMMIHTGTP